MTMPHVDRWVKLLIVAVLAGIGGTSRPMRSGAGRTAVGDQGMDAEKTPAQKRSEAMRKLYEDPEFRKRQAQGSLETWKDPEYREKISRARREQHARGRGGRGGGPK
jgi:hypothetical protein